MKNIIVLFAFVSMFIAGCSEPTTEQEYSNQIVVSGYLIANHPIDSIVVERTVRIDETYSPSNAAIRNAIVVVTANGISDTLSEISPGKYSSPQIIFPKTKYSLYIRVPDGRIVRGETTVPDTFHIEQRPPTQVTYATTTPMITWSASNLNSDYILSVTSLDTSEHKPIPLESIFADSIERARRTDFTFGFEEIRHSEIPWFAFHYYGLNAISVLAIDKNYYQFFQQLFSPPTDIKEYKYNLQGGIGVFGSAAMDSVHIVVLR